MALTLYYTIRKGGKAIGDNGFTTVDNIKTFTSIEDAYNWLDQQTDAPSGVYTVDTFIRKSQE